MDPVLASKVVSFSGEDRAGDIDLNQNYNNLMILSCYTLDTSYSQFYHHSSSPYKFITSSIIFLISIINTPLLLPPSFIHISDHSQFLIHPFNMQLRRFLLLAFLFISFITASGRSLRETRNIGDDHHDGNYKGQSEKFNDEKMQKQLKGEKVDGDDLVTMDYTPAKKNPPIHN